MGDGTPARLDSRAMTQADLTRQRLIRAALELFTTTGYHFTTTPLIARKAGVAEGTIYRHFDSKQHLLNELYRAAGRWAVRVVKEADGLKVGPREKLAELRSEEHTSELQSQSNLVCRLLLEKKKKKSHRRRAPPCRD